MTKTEFLSAKPHILVIGDCMLDEYVYGDVNRISPEAPVPILNMKKSNSSLGGAANVAHNLITMGCKVTLLSPLSIDHKLITELESVGINYDSSIVTERQTITKTRFYSGSHYMLRVDNEETDNFDDQTYKILLDSIKHSLKENDVNAIVLSDYAKGLFTLEFSQEVIALANKYNVKVLVDSKPQNFDFFKGATLLKPNLKEAQTFYHKSKMRNDEIGINLIKDLQLKSVLITAADKGMYFIDKMNKQIGCCIEIPAIQIEVVDTCGAGDSVLAAVAKCYATNVNNADMLIIAQVVGHISCSHIGIAAVTINEISERL